MSRNAFRNDWECIECGCIKSKHDQWFEGLCEVCHEETQIDLFTTPEVLPAEVLAIVEKLGESDPSYEGNRLAVICLEKLGYTFDYGLDAIPFNLIKL
jgi:hypothetical protein